MTHLEKPPIKSPITRDVLRILAIIVALVIFVMAPGISRAAQLSFNPANMGIAMSPGEARTITFKTSLAEATQSSSFASFFVALTSGSLPRTWVTRSDYITLNGPQGSGAVSLTISVPASAHAGTYTGAIRPTGIRASEQTTTEVLNLYVEVMEKGACNQPPTISGVVAGESIVRANNKKPLTFEFTGNISSLPGCTTEKAYFILSDEYGELDKSEPIQLDDAGNFRVAIPVIASRQGNDKDGRLFTVAFGADNEAGTTVGGEQRIVISHDSRK